MSLTIEPIDGGAAIKFRFDVAIKDALKTAFPQARWRTDDLAWIVPGDGAVAEVSAWWESTGPGLQGQREQRKAEARANRELFKEFADHEWEEAVGDARANPVDSPYAKLSEDGTHWLVTTPYDERIKAILAGLMGARFHRGNKHWLIPVFSTEALRLAAPEINVLAAKVAISAPKAVEGAVVSQKSPRFLALVSDAPDLDVAVERGDSAIVPLKHGAAFKANERTVRDNPGAGIKAGDEVRYVYYREATPEETEDLSNATSLRTP